MLDDDEKSLHIAKGHFEKPQTQLFETLKDAIDNRHILHFTYSLKPRVAKPYKLVHIQGIWYLLASESRKLKHFTLSKIQNLIDTKEHFTPSQKVATLLKSSLNSTAYLTTTPKTAQILLTTPKARTHFLRKNLGANFTIIHDSRTNLTLQMQYAFDDEVINFVKSWLPHAQIIQPTTLQVRFQKMLLEYIKATNADTTSE
ncbi:WYL domain-containing protein [Helicobacter sp. T3_23-1056]